jgi:hypothetical protein
VFGFDFSPKKTRARPRRTPPTLHYIIVSFLIFSRTATIKTISDYLRDDNNNIMCTKWARVQSSGRLILSRIVYFYNTPTVIHPPGTQHSTMPPLCFYRRPVPHRKSTTTVYRKEIHLTRRFLIAQIVVQYNITCRHIYIDKYYWAYNILIYILAGYCRLHSSLPDLAFVTEICWPFKNHFSITPPH